MSKVNDWLFQKLGDKIKQETKSFLNKTDLFDSAELTKKLPIETHAVGQF